MIDYVVPIPPSYDKDEEFCVKDTERYLEYLEENDVASVMTTAGTSQYNLLSYEEIILLNKCVSSTTIRRKIIGLPPLSGLNLKKFIDDMGVNDSDDNTHYMALYPDRFYDNDSVIDYFTSISNHIGRPIYVHGMFMRNGRGGTWNFTADIINKLFEQGVVVGIKEEHSDMSASYNFTLNLPDELDVIVAGGSMRRHQFLRNAGAKAFLSGIGNLFPKIEQEYCNGMIEESIKKENELFSVFNRHGWHRSLRIALSLLNLGCTYDRMPWPSRDESVVNEIDNVIKKIGSDYE